MCSQCRSRTFASRFVVSMKVGEPGKGHCTLGKGTVWLTTDPDLCSTIDVACTCCENTAMPACSHTHRQLRVGCEGPIVGGPEDEQRNGANHGCHVRGVTAAGGSSQCGKVVRSSHASVRGCKDEYVADKGRVWC
jgi:hypothetical protein